MIFENFVEVDLVNHIARRNDDIRLIDFFNVLDVVHEVGDIVVVNLRHNPVFAIKDAQASALGVNVVLPAVAQMLDQGTRFVLNEHFNLGNPGIGHVGKHKVDQTVTTQKGDRRGRAVIHQTCDIDTGVFKVDNS